MDSVPGDKFVDDCARYIRFNEAKLGQSSGGPSATAWMNPTGWLRGLPSTAKPAVRAPMPRPTPLRLTSHHLYYLLIRFEGLGIPTGPLDVQIPSSSRSSSYFAFISNTAAGSGLRRKDRDDTMSISSLQTTMSALSTLGMGGNQSSSSGWWGGRKPDVAGEIKYIYSAMTRIPALRIGPPPLKLIDSFEDCPGELSVPLDVFKNVQLIEFEDTDPRSFLGWDRLSMQLRSLSIKRSGVEDITDIIVDAVINDGKQRRGERVRHRKRRIHAPAASDDQGLNQSVASDSTASNASSEAPLHTQLPSLSWHFLRHLSLSDNSLTFMHSSCLSCLSSLTSLDLSNNLLNAVPPSLNLLPGLESLNLTNNLIDSVIGIPTSLPSIKALNLSHNRLESLCGLERLPTLIRIDLRKNEIFEAGEVGRLATLPRIAEVYIGGNPLFEEVDDARVEVFIEFAREGRELDTIKLDSEGIGYFEKQRVRERIPNLDRLAGRKRDLTPSVDEAFSSSGLEDAKSVTAKQTTPAPNAVVGEQGSAQPVIKTVRHRNTHSTTLPKTNVNRRNRRIVELAQDVGGEREREAEVSDSDAIKRAALAGDTDAALGAVTGGDQQQPGEAALRGMSPPVEVQRPTSPMSTLTRKSGMALAAVSKDWEESSTLKLHGHVRTQSHEDRPPSPMDAKAANTSLQPSEEAAASQGARPRARVGRRNVDPARRSKVTMSLHDPGSRQLPVSSSPQQAGGDNDLRRKIEALKGEVGDDWLRLLARGESVYVPREEDEEEEREGRGE